MIKLTVYAYGLRGSAGKFFPEQPEVVLINKRVIVAARKDTITMPDKKSQELFQIYINEGVGTWNILYATNKELEEGFDS